ncbi:MAG: Serine/threonine phosphatase stp [Firmicutes bacterium ADurb.Bin419]|nr:MAG: Serine/threonine phosphatase stp [Firmicutes bacterium ADurb.Bin419]
MSTKLKIDASVITTKGNIRSKNEDNFYFNGLIMKKTDDSDLYSHSLNTTEDRFIFAVCDGMGGEEAGEEASLTAVQSLSDMYVARESKEFNSMPQLKNFMDNYVDISNSLIFKHSQAISKHMGTTLASVIFFGDKAIALNIGDSRVYLFRNSDLVQLTIDHTEAERLIRLGIIERNSPYLQNSNNMLTRHLGVSPQCGKMEADYSDEIKLQKGDLFLICSDGLTNHVSDKELKRCFSDPSNSYSTCKNLIDQAIKNNGTDNITALIIKIEDVLI